MSKREEVTIVSCNSYNQKEVDRAVNRALDNIGFNFKKNKKVLIKPNLIGPYKIEKGATTHPSIIKSICKILKKNNSKIIIAESSYANTKKAFTVTGIEKVAKKYNAKLVELDEEDLVKIKGKGFLKTFYLPRIFKQVDLVINVPKMKTHVLMRYTGAIKNLYGTITGGRKRLFHKKYQEEKNFAHMLVDLYETINPDLNIMDAVYGMEGNGPTSGEKKKTGLILASRNGAALDSVACDIIGFKKNKVLTNKIARKRGLTKKIKIIGNKPSITYKKPKTMLPIAAAFRFMNRYMLPKIVLEKEKCILCHTCERHCPTKAMKLKPYPEIDKKKCIRCFCCVEVCPKHALDLHDHNLVRALNKAYHLVTKPFRKKAHC